MNTIIILITFFNYNLVQFSENEHISTQILNTINNESTLFLTKKKKIPKCIFGEIDRLTKDDFRLVNPDKKFRPTDKIEDQTISNRRLIFAANYGNDWVIYYEKGGRAYNTLLVFAEISGKKVKYLNGMNLQVISDPKRLKDKKEELQIINDALKNGSYRLFYSSREKLEKEIINF